MFLAAWNTVRGTGDVGDSGRRRAATDLMGGSF